MWTAHIAVGMACLAAAPDHAPPGWGPVVQQTLPSVVLIINQYPDGKMGYGSGFVVSPDGLILTSLHVVANRKVLSAMLYDPARQSYTPMDGGLSRYIFENQKDLKPLHLVRGDPTNDLALVRVETTAPLRPLQLQTRVAVQPGDAVIAVGHPRETVWAFTSGVVSSLHQGVIQHDAPINQGNSGGPLLNAQGEVVGINSMKLLGGAEGISFAVQAGLAGSVLVGPGVGPLDRSTPEKAVLSCARAYELALSRLGECMDLEAHYPAFLAVAGKTRKAAQGMGPLRTAENILKEHGGKETWAVLYRRLITAMFLGREQDAREAMAAFGQEYQRSVRDSGVVAQVGVKMERAERDMPAAPPTQFPELNALVKSWEDSQARQEKYKGEMDAVLLKQHGLKVDSSNPRKWRDLLKMGTRVDEVRHLSPQRAWTLVAGSNLDGTPYRYSRLWLLKGDAWVEVTPYTPAELKTLPKGWPPPLIQLPNSQVDGLLGALALQMLMGDAGAETNVQVELEEDEKE